jgi:serine O-acetyltransferase
LSRTYLDPRTEIGSGFVIHNFSSIVINARSIGENLTINQGVFVGPDWRNNGLPKIGNNVFLGSGAKVLGDVKVGNNVVVAANSVITRSIEDNCMVAGVPGMVIKRGLDADYVGNVPAHSR